MDNHSECRGHRIDPALDVSTTVWIVNRTLTRHIRQVVSKEDDK